MSKDNEKKGCIGASIYDKGVNTCAARTAHADAADVMSE